MAQVRDIQLALPECAREPVVTTAAAAPIGISASLVRRLVIPATPSELAASLGFTIKQVRTHLSNLKGRRKVCRLDRRVPKQSKRGRQWEYLWSSIV